MKIISMSFFVTDELTLGQFFKTFFFRTDAFAKWSRLRIPSKPFQPQPCLTFVSEEESVYLIILPKSFFIRDEWPWVNFFKLNFFRTDALAKWARVGCLPSFFNLVKYLWLRKLVYTWKSSQCLFSLETNQHRLNFLYFFL